MLKTFTSCWPHISRNSRLTILLKFGSKAPLKKRRNLSLGLRRGPWRLWSWMRALDSMKMASRCLKTLTGKSREYQQLHKELWGGSEGEEKVFASAASVFDFFKSSSGTRVSPPVLLDIGDDDPDDRPTVQEEEHPKGTRRPYIHVSLTSQGHFYEDVTSIYTPNGLAKQY